MGTRALELSRLRLARRMTTNTPRARMSAKRRCKGAPSRGEASAQAVCKQAKPAVSDDLINGMRQGVVDSDFTQPGSIGFERRF